MTPNSPKCMGTPMFNLAVLTFVSPFSTFYLDLPQSLFSPVYSNLGRILDLSRVVHFSRSL